MLVFMSSFLSKMSQAEDNTEDTGTDIIVVLENKRNIAILIVLLVMVPKPT